jgi:hypothetical protein
LPGELNACAHSEPFVQSMNLGRALVSQSLTVAATSASLWFVQSEIIESWIYWLAVSAFVVVSELTSQAWGHFSRLRSPPSS